MPIENRTLSFNNQELAEALGGYNAITKQPFTSGMVVAVDLEQDPKPLFRIVVQDRQIARRTTVTLEPEHMAAALISFCRIKRVPLPRKAKKTLHVESGRVVLHIVKER